MCRQEESLCNNSLLVRSKKLASSSNFKRSWHES